MHNAHPSDPTNNHRIHNIFYFILDQITTIFYPEISFDMHDIDIHVCMFSLEAANGRILFVPQIDFVNYLC